MGPGQPQASNVQVTRGPVTWLCAPEPHALSSSAVPKYIFAAELATSQVEVTGYPVSHSVSLASRPPSPQALTRNLFLVSTSTYNLRGREVAATVGNSMPPWAPRTSSGLGELIVGSPS